MFVSSPGYAHLPDRLKFVNFLIALLSEKKYDVIIPAPNREVEAMNLRLLRSELPAVWSDISYAMGGLKDHFLHMLVLDEVLGFDLSNFSRQLKMKPEVDDGHQKIVEMSNDLWFSRVELDEEEKPKRQCAKETKAHFEAMVLQTKPEAKKWLHLNPRIAALGIDAFERGPPMIVKIHAYLVREMKLADNEGEKSAKFIDRMCQTTLEALWTGNERGEEGLERTDSMLEGLGARWTSSFMAKSYPGLSRYVIR